MTDFKKYQPVFKNGFAIARMNRKEFARYPRIDQENSNRTTKIYKSDFAVINTQFDTLLNFNDVPFLLNFGTLNNNRRTFFLHPYMGLHADIGISYGQYGYLDGRGSIAIQPKFRASDVFIRLAQGYVRDADCPFYSNLSMVRELEEYYFIDTLGNKVFELHTDRESLFNVSQFNNYGVAAYRTSGKSTNGRNPNPSKIHLIDSTGTIIHEAFESDSPISYVAGNVSHLPQNDLIPIYDKVSGFLRVYTPDFKPFSNFPLLDSSEGVNYEYRGFLVNKLNNEFILKQYKRPQGSHAFSLSHKRLIDKNQNPKFSWIPFKSILNPTYGNFTMINSNSSKSTLYDFDKNKLFECDSCFILYSYKLNSNGIYKVQLHDKKFVFVNYKGKVISALFDAFEERVYDISHQVENFNKVYHQTIIAKEDEFIKLFRESIMYERIIK